MLATPGAATPKTLIYCRTINTASWLYGEFIASDILHRSLVTQHIKPFISRSFDDDKDKVLNSLFDDDASVRVVLATSALGCGVNVKNVEFVIHFGPSFDT
eukprot:TCONS_00034454-protein